MKQILLIPKVLIQNANALSSPYTIGFPAMTAWFGAVHALKRKLSSHELFKFLEMNEAAVICHQINLQTHKNSSDSFYSIIGTGNPLDKHGQRSAFVEEARCHLTVSLVIQCSGLNPVDHEAFIAAVSRYLMTMKLASGDILNFELPELMEINNTAAFNQLIRRLVPGYCLIERRDLMQQAMESGQDAIDALLDNLVITHRCISEKNGRVKWHSNRKEKGWIVPIATGFHGLGDLTMTANQRDADLLHCFAESIVTLGEFVMPYRLSDLKNLLWHRHVDLRKRFYLYQQD